MDRLGGHPLLGIVELGVGFLIDHVFEPGVASGESLWWRAGGWLFGTGPGAGSAMLMALTGSAGLAIVLLACFLPVVRDVEGRLPDAIATQTARRADH